MADASQPSREELQQLASRLNAGLEELDRSVLRVRLSLTQFAVDMDGAEAPASAVKLGQDLAALVGTAAVVRDAAIMLNNGLP